MLSAVTGYIHGLFWQLAIMLLELLWVTWHPRLWRWFLFYQVEYLFFSPYYYVDRQAKADDVYGFTPIFTASSVLARAIRLHKNGSEALQFMDLGAGDGRVVFAMALESGFSATGIEKNERFTRKANVLIRYLQLQGITLVAGDFFKAKLKEYDIIWVSWTTYSEATVKKLTQKFRKEISIDSVVVSLSFPVPDEAFTLLWQGSALFSWGLNQVFIQRKTS